MAQNAGESVVKASGNPACIEAADRFIRNDNIDPEVIAEEGFNQVCGVARQCSDVLAIQDTTGLSFKHSSLCADLGNISFANTGSKSPKGRSLLVHSTLLLDAKSEQTRNLGSEKKKSLVVNAKERMTST